MRSAVAGVCAALCLVLGCKSRTTPDQELCAKAAAMFERCEELDVGSGSDAALSRELTIDRWRGLCRAVLTGKTEQLMANARELYNGMDEGTKAGLRVQAECTAAATTCADYKTCESRVECSAFALSPRAAAQAQ